MNRGKLLAVLVVVSTSLVGCVSPRMNLSIPDDTAIRPAEEKALVYFLRPKKMAFGIHAAVYDDEEFIGFVPYRQKLPYLASPGEHLFMAVSEAADFLKADLLPGKTYFIQVVPRMGGWRARFSLAPVTREELGKEEVQEWIEEARTIRNNQAAYAWAEANHDSVLEKKATYLQKWNEKPEQERPYLRSEDAL